MMYPVLTGFWRSASISAAILCFLVYKHDTRHGVFSLSGGMFVAVAALIYLMPLLRIWLICRSVEMRADRPTALSGAIIGSIATFIFAYFILSML